MAVDYVALTRSLAEPLASSLGLSVWGVEYIAGGKSTLRVFVEKDGGASVDDCAELSRLLALSLDVEVAFDVPWVLEVSTPGLERTFFSAEQLQNYIGQTLSAVLKTPHPGWPMTEQARGRKNFVGKLTEVKDSVFTLAIPKEQRLSNEPEFVEIDWDTVRRVHLVHDFSGQSKKTPGNGGKK